MYDKSVRRRRAVLAALVVCSLVLLTAYFGESQGSPLHSVQRGFLQVVSPIQDGASRALKPVRDLFGWAGDTLHAKGERDSLRRQLGQARAEAAADAANARQFQDLSGLLGIDKDVGLDQMGPIMGRVIGRSPTIWYSTVTINKGSGAGVRVGQPALTSSKDGGPGLVGRVSSVTGDAAIVTLVTDHTSGVSATVAQSGVTGVVQPAVGDPNDLLLEFIRRSDQVKTGQTLVTAGSKSDRLESLFPPGIPIGRVTKVDDRELAAYQRVHVKPFALLRRLDFVQILTKPDTKPGAP